MITYDLEAMAKLKQEKLLEACENVIWKLNRNEMIGNECVPAKIDRNDIVVKDLVEVVQAVLTRKSVF